ncbi:hypothetical protein NDQ72_08250 [Halomonas sp. KG2]|uniref:hypothetical protein n=1 Tax=Halomonas sp. KG2 TaxID=2951138 RepID=UPI002647186E|nr:hypothetical protein [Halomonas sp. KG2]WKD29919.1 hypothetical protein NDQ72_08250 [Halomonas sp. KG2]
MTMESEEFKDLILVKPLQSTKKEAFISLFIAVVVTLALVAMRLEIPELEPYKILVSQVGLYLAMIGGLLAAYDLLYGKRVEAKALEIKREIERLKMANKVELATAELSSEEHTQSINSKFKKADDHLSILLQDTNSKKRGHVQGYIGLAVFVLGTYLQILGASA